MSAGVATEHVVALPLTNLPPVPAARVPLRREGRVLACPWETGRSHSARRAGDTRGVLSSG